MIHGLFELFYKLVDEWYGTELFFLYDYENYYYFTLQEKLLWMVKMKLYS